MTDEKDPYYPSSKAVETYIKNLEMEQTDDHIRTLIAGNIRAFAGWCALVNEDEAQCTSNAIKEALEIYDENRKTADTARFHLQYAMSKLTGDDAGRKDRGRGLMGFVGEDNE